MTYTEFEGIRRFIYADDLCLATQAQDFKTIEERLSKALEKMTEYYHQNSLNANPSKTQVCAFHLNNHKAEFKLPVTCWKFAALFEFWSGLQHVF